MIQVDSTATEKMYTFRGKTFPANPTTIKQLNYALALNRAPDRYVEVPALSKQKDDTPWLQ
jgi:hypothetical protein